jgi:hypothetical protein
MLDLDGRVLILPPVFGSRALTLTLFRPTEEEGAIGLLLFVNGSSVIQHPVVRRLGAVSGSARFRWRLHRKNR